MVKYLFMFSETIDRDAPTMAPDGRGRLLAGRYRVVKPLGQGGMGSVWLAENVQLDNRPVALKMLPSILVKNKRAYAQLKSEALVSLKLVHPNIVALRAFEENDGNPFLVMDYIEGQTLDDYLAEKGTLSEDEIIKILRPIAAALDYAHGEKVVHRDIKPANVMIRKDGHPFILDFGIAREMQETMTRVTGKLSSGTLLYMSPEQLHGASPKPAQDVYSFAAMVYECLSGKPPFARGQIEYQIDHDKPEPLESHAFFAASVMRGLEKKPEARPTRCLDVLRCLATHPVPARVNVPPRASVPPVRPARPAPPPPPVLPVQQKKSLALPLVLIAVCLAALIGAIIVRTQRLPGRTYATAARNAEPSPMSLPRVVVVTNNVPVKQVVTQVVTNNVTVVRVITNEVVKTAASAPDTTSRPQQDAAKTLTAITDDEREALLRDLDGANKKSAAPKAKPAAKAKKTADKKPAPRKTRFVPYVIETQKIGAILVSKKKYVEATGDGTGLIGPIKLPDGRYALEVLDSSGPVQGRAIKLKSGDKSVRHFISSPDIGETVELELK